jgi:hypothetical protein
MTLFIGEKMNEQNKAAITVSKSIELESGYSYAEPMESTP